MCEFGEYVEMFPYTVRAVKDILFGDTRGYDIPSSPVWSGDFVPWSEENMSRRKQTQPDRHGYEILQGRGTVTGHLLGGCLDVFVSVNGTALWPAPEQWRGALLFLETSEEKPSPDFVCRTLRNLAAQGILRAVNGILVGKPQGEVHYEAYKRVILQVVAEEEGLTGLPILYNVNIGHAMPTGILPYGVKARLDCDNRRLTLLESATV